LKQQTGRRLSGIQLVEINAGFGGATKTAMGFSGVSMKPGSLVKVCKTVLKPPSLFENS
jgi:hypothetical protein